MPSEDAYPNQWYTPVIVKVYRTYDGARLREENFADLQMAWIWIKNQVGDQLEYPNFLDPFALTVERLSESHADGERGYACAEKGELEYCVFYTIPLQQTS